MKAPQRILVPTDFSPYADKALEEGLFLAKQFHAELHLLHVVPGIQQCTADYCLTEEFVQRYQKLAVENSMLKTKSALDRHHEEAKDVTVDTRIRVGNPDEEILKEEKEKGIDLIVIASHGRTGLMGYLMGSVAERVSRGAKGNVLLVKA